MEGRTVLICEDDEGITELTQVILEGKGYKVVALNDSTNIFARIEEAKPDLVLLDLWMPGLSGEEVTRRLKADPLTNHIPAIIISANRDTEQIAARAGADAFLAKPFDIADLEDLVEKCLSK